MSDLPSSSSSVLPDELGFRLRGKLATVRRKLVRVEFVRRIAVAMSVAVVGLVFVLSLDWLVDLPLDVRTGVIIGLAALFLVFLLRALVALVTQRRDEETLALMVEEREPGFRSRLIASVQFALGKATVPDSGARLIVERMVEETESFARPLRLTEVVNTRPLKRALLFFLVLGGLAGGGYYLGGSITEDLLKRAFLSDVPVPRATRVVWTSRDLRIGIGDSVTVEGRVEGYEPEEGSLRIRYASGRRQKIRMERGSEGSLYRATLENVQESFTFRVVIKDGRSSRESVIALPRPSVEELVGEQRYPGYMNLPSSLHQPGEFLLYPDSKLLLRITASQSLREATFRLLGEGEQVSLVGKVDSRDPRVAEVAVGVKQGLTGFTVDLLDTEGMDSRDTAVYRVDVLTDEPPKVRLVKPSRQRELVTAQARVLVGYEAEDRFGIERMALSYKVGGEGAEGTLELPIPERGNTKLAEFFDWELGQIEP
ncbi:MAG: hypothetical protein MK194_16890, partial [Roseibacillus sp.]|nr:hypothetical protein [Roseibacillus sp.]